MGHRIYYASDTMYLPRSVDMLILISPLTVFITTPYNFFI